MVACHVIRSLAVVVAEMSYGRGRVDGVTVFRDDRVETVDSVGGVVHDTEGAVGLHQTVLTLDVVAVTVLSLGLNVTGQGVSHSIIV
jgi:hypothetical protein